MQTSLDKLMYHFEQLPGVGPRQARRYVYSLLKRSQNDLESFAGLLQDLKRHVHECPSCGLFHTGDQAICHYCTDSTRNPALLMIVEKDADLETVEKSALFNGYYVVLGGVLPIAGKNQIREALLTHAIKERVTHGLEEVILGLSATTEGEQTRERVLDLITPLLPEEITLSTFGRGLATGTEIEYSDTETLRSALQNRK